MMLDMAFSDDPDVCEALKRMCEFTKRQSQKDQTRYNRCERPSRTSASFFRCSIPLSCRSMEMRDLPSHVLILSFTCLYRMVRDAV